MIDLVNISLYARHPAQTSPGYFLVAMLVLIGIVFYIDHRKEKKDGTK